MKSSFGIFSGIFLDCKSSTLSLLLQIVVFIVVDDDDEGVDCTIVRKDEFANRSNDIRQNNNVPRFNLVSLYVISMKNLSDCFPQRLVNM